MQDIHAQNKEPKLLLLHCMVHNVLNLFYLRNLVIEKLRQKLKCTFAIVDQLSTCV